MITNQVLLIFFALPIAVIIISIALQRIFKEHICANNNNVNTISNNSQQDLRM